MKMKSKDNWTMRAAVLMFALVLITSSFVGGTFAKYVTEGSGTDHARVAKFGVTIEANDDTAFKTTYAKDDNSVTGATIINSVVSGNTDKVLAPGTKEDGTVTFKITGKPEVAVNVSMDLKNISEIFLKAGTYDDLTGTEHTGKFNLATDYYPVVFDLYRGDATTPAKSGKLTEIKTYLNTFSKNYPAGTNLSAELGEFKLSWHWDFDGASTNDKADTLLGAFGTGYTPSPTLTLNTDYQTSVAFTIEATVTQID